MAETDKDKAQVDKFRKLARALGSDEDEKSFNEKLGNIARQKPDDSEKKKD